MHAGLRTESIRTRGENPDGTRPTNSSRVTTPLVHFLYKPDPKQRDQIRISLTRSYKSPTLNNLIARPSYSSRYSDLTQTNDATSPDRVGNATLRPELATGIDVAFERYLADGGVLSANVFVRRLKDYIRTVTSLQPVDYSPALRWVSRPENVGRASTAGLELEAKFRLDQLIADAPRIEVRSNASVFRSRVDQVPGPDNRLDQQPPGTANLGLDYRFRGTPLTLGGNLNVTPSYKTQVSEIQALTTPVKHQLDLYALWVFDPTMQLRLNVTNLNAADYVTSSVFDLDTTRQRQVTTNRTYLNFRISLELKL
jgi:iron complex outermembrane receptor protein